MSSPDRSHLDGFVVPGDVMGHGQPCEPSLAPMSAHGAGTGPQKVLTMLTARLLCAYDAYSVTQKVLASTMTLLAAGSCLLVPDALGL